MAYDGALLAVGVVKALASIPTAIKEIKTLLTEHKIDKDVVIDKVDKLKKSIIDFCHSEGWLEEAKVLHESLQCLDTELEKARSEYIRSISHGRFDEQAYRMSVIQEVWYGVKMNSLNKLLSKAQSLKHIEPHPLVLDRNGIPTSGPDWASRIVDLRMKLDKALEQYNKQNLDIKMLADAMNELVNYVKYQMHIADERIRQEMAIFGKELYILMSKLENI